MKGAILKRRNKNNTDVSLVTASDVTVCVA